jgi:hypothetical protein
LIQRTKFNQNAKASDGNSSRAVLVNVSGVFVLIDPTGHAIIAAYALNLSI